MSVWRDSITVFVMAFGVIVFVMVFAGVSSANEAGYYSLSEGRNE